jgi:very-short-patch-repair endonuclease
MDKDVLLRIAAEAARHHGVISRQAALDVGATRNQISRQLARGHWQRPLPGVYLLPGSPATWERAVAIAVLGSGTGAIASHATAAHLWDLGRRPKFIEVTSPHQGIPRRGHVIHRSTDLIPENVTLVSGIPCSTVVRLLVDVGIPWGDGFANRCLDEAIRRELATERAVARELHRVARKGRNGVGPLRRVLSERLGWSSLTESQLESEFLRIMQAAGILLPKGQVRIVKRGGRLIARVDFVFDEIRLVIALDGEAYHSDRQSFRHDRRQQNDLVLENYRVIRFTAFDIFAAPEYVVATVVAALRAERYSA